MFQSLKAMPFPSWIYALALASLSAQVAFVIRIFRRCKAKPWLTTTPEVSGLWPAVAVLLLGLLLPAGAIAFVEPARRAMIALAIGPPGSELSYYTLFPSPQDRLSLLPYVPGWIAISALLGACALTLALTTRWRVLARLSATVPEAQALRQRPPIPATGDVALVVFGFLFAGLAPFLIGMVACDRRMESTLAMTAQAPSWATQEHVLLEGLAQAKHAVWLGNEVAILGLALASMVAVAFLRRWQRQGVRWQHDRHLWTKTFLGCALSLMVGGVLIRSARPLHAENHTPWPEGRLGTNRVWAPPSASNRSEILMQDHVGAPWRPLPGVLTPEATHGLRTTTLLEISATSFRVDAVASAAADLRARLRDARTRRTLFHPTGDDSSTVLAVLAASDVSCTTVNRGLLAAYDVGYQSVDLVSYQLETTVRPMLGPLRRVRWTATPATLALATPPTAVPPDHARLSCRDFDHFEALLATVLQHAHSGRDVVLDVYQPAQE